MSGNLVRWVLIRPIIKPLTRFFVGLIAIPIFRFCVRRGGKRLDLSAEVERDLEEWFRGALILLVATANMEHYLFGWLPLDLDGDQAWIGVFFRLFLAIGVIELMPDQAVFSVLHGGPIEIKWRRRIFHEFCANWKERLKKIGCMHLNRSSPVLAIMAAIFGGTFGSTESIVGWVCYGLAIVQYLIIALIISKDLSENLIEKFDQAVAERREELVEEFGDDEVTSDAPT